MASGYEREVAPPLEDRLAEDLRGFGPLGILAIVVILSGNFVLAGFGEETVFRGYMFERSRRLFGSSVLAKTLTVAFTAAWFGSLHYREQGLAGAEQAWITGLTFGTIFAITGRIWMLVFAHAAYDVVAILLIYLNLESQVAHFLFK